MRKTHIGTAVVCLIIISIVGCGDSIDIEQAKIVAVDFMKAFDTESLDNIRAMCTSDLIGEADSLDYIDRLAAIHEKLGPYRSSHMLGWREKENNAGQKQLILQFSVNYAYYPATETISIIRTGSDSLKIAGHTVSSNALKE